MVFTLWTTLVKIITDPATNANVWFAKIQEAWRKDVERAFGALQARFVIIGYPALTWSTLQIWKVMLACVITYNMIIESERNDLVNDMLPYDHMEPLASSWGRSRGAHWIWCFLVNVWSHPRWTCAWSAASRPRRALALKGNGSQNPQPNRPRLIWTIIYLNLFKHSISCNKLQFVCFILYLNVSSMHIWPFYHGLIIGDLIVGRCRCVKRPKLPVFLASGHIFMSAGRLLVWTLLGLVDHISFSSGYPLESFPRTSTLALWSLWLCRSNKVFDAKMFFLCM